MTVDVWSARHFEWLSAYRSVDPSWRQVRVDLGTNVREIVADVARQLEIPPDASTNFDAMSDLLSDLSWLSDRGVVIIHTGEPGLNTRDLKVYFSVLTSALDAWWERPPVRLRVMFEEECEADLLPILDSVQREWYAD